jgi:hypothetical protein
MIAADIGVHEAGHGFIGFGIAVISEPLNKRTRAIANPDDADAYAAAILKPRVHR